MTKVKAKARRESQSLDGMIGIRHPGISPGTLPIVTGTFMTPGHGTLGAEVSQAHIVERVPIFNPSYKLLPSRANFLACLCRFTR